MARQSLSPRTRGTISPRRSSRERGRGVLGCLLWILLLGALGYVGVRFAIPYVEYWRFKDAMSMQAKAAELNSNAEIYQVLTEIATELDIPLAPADLKIERRRGVITISADWTKDVVLPKYRRVLSFHPQVSDTISGRSP